MPSIKSVLAASAIAFFTSTNGHMILLTPPPYGNPNSSPLDASGSDFPCKGSSNSGGQTTNMAIGSKQQLSFKGSAVHGGGSCQVSLTTDNPATKNSKWQVIHSIEGGCPARGAAGNLGDNPDMQGKDRYDYTIPQGINPGKYTLAWTWFNKIGNREMYMNCANVQITGGSKKRDTSLNETEFAIPELSERASPSFPAMFVANVPATDCTTPDSQDLQFPDPGTSVEKAGSGPLSPPKGPKCGAAGTSASTSGGSSSSGSSGSSSGGSSGAGSSGSSGAAPAAPSTPAAGGSGSGSSGASSAAPGAAAGGASSGSTSGSSGAPDSQANAGSGSGSAAPSGSSSGSGSASASAGAGSSAGSSAGTGSAPSSNSKAAGAATGSCTQPGQSICSPDGKQIGTCTQSNTVTWIPVAAGTKCAGGQMVMAKSKRSARFSNDYMFGQ